MTARPYTDPGLELEDRLDDLLSEPPAAGWAAVLNSIVLRVPAPTADAQEPAVADAVPDPASRPLFATLLKDAVASCPSAGLLLPLAMSAAFSPELVRQLAAGLAAELRACSVALLVLPGLRLIDSAEGAPVAGNETLAAGYSSEPYLAGRVIAALLRGAAGTATARGVAVVLETSITLLNEGAEPDRWRERVFELLAVAVRDGRARGLLLDKLQDPAVPFETGPAETGPTETLRRERSATETLPIESLRDALGDDSLLLLAHAHEGSGEVLADRLASLDAEALLAPGAGPLPWAGALSEREQKRRATRLLRLKLSLGLFDVPAPAVLPRADFMALKGRLALASMVQLVNEASPEPNSESAPAPLLPLPSAASVQIFVSSALAPELRERLATAFTASALNSTLTLVGAGLTAQDPEAGQEALLEAAAAGDVALWIAPAADPDALVLQTLRSTATPLMVVALGPESTLPLLTAGGVAALVQCFGPLDASLEQLPAVLTGERLATGRMPHRLCAPAFPFGSGAAGSAVVYETLSGPTSADTSSVVVLTQTLSNPGPRTVVEVPQLYRRNAEHEDSLLGFARCTLNPGETLSVRFQLDTSLLAAVVEDGSWLVTPEPVSLYVGAAAGRPESALAIELRGAERRLKQHQRVSTLIAVDAAGRPDEH